LILRCCKEGVGQIQSLAASDHDPAKMAFEYVRDKIGRSFDLNSAVATI